MTIALIGAILNHMVQYSNDTLDGAFRALADRTRRRLLTRLIEGERRVSDLAAPLDITLTAVSKHLRVLERAGFITREKVGRERLCRLEGRALAQAAAWIADYRALWSKSFDLLEDILPGTTHVPETEGKSRDA